MFERAHRKCKEIRKRVYPKEDRPGAILEQALAPTAEGQILLEVGCGREALMLRRAGRAYRLAIGVDVEIAAQAEDPSPVRLILGDGHRLPLADRSVDTVAMVDVVEHFADPATAFREFHRVLRPGGRMLISTVNKWFPPIMLGRPLPHKLRQRLVHLATGAAEEDVFKTYYRANSRADLLRTAGEAGFEPLTIRFLSHHPDYFEFSVLAYRLAVRVEQVVRKSRRLAFLRQIILAEFVRPNDGMPAPVREMSCAGAM